MASTVKKKDDTLLASSDKTKSSNTNLSTNNASSNGSTSIADYSAQYNQNSWSPNVQSAYTQLQSITNSKPSGYTSNYQSNLSDIYNKIMNREAFSYDINEDALYNQYKQQYMSLGNQAMQDTIGKASAMTGGYGNSYASTAGNQAYQNYLSQLNNVVPELYNQAYNQYNQETNDLYNQLNATSSLDSADYSKYRDTVSDYYNDYNNAYNLFNAERNADQTSYENAFDKANTNRNYAYQVGRDAISDSQWQQTFNYNKDRDAVSDSQWQQTFDYNKSKDSSTSANSGMGLTSAQVSRLQTALNSGNSTMIASELASAVASGTLTKEDADTLYDLLVPEDTTTTKSGMTTNTTDGLRALFPYISNELKNKYNS